MNVAIFLKILKKHLFVNSRTFLLSYEIFSDTPTFSSDSPKATCLYLLSLLKIQLFVKQL